jgi:general secretion pathway protein M
VFENIATKVSEQWLTLSEKDKKAAILLMISTLLAIIVFGVIQPIRSYQANAVDSLAKSQETYQSLVEIAPQALANNSDSPTFSTSSLNSEIRRQAVRNGITIQRFEPDGDNFKVWLDEARYPAMVKWLSSLEAMGIAHIELTLESKNKPGFVSVRVTFGMPKS